MDDGSQASKEALGGKLRARRADLGLTMQHVADQAGVSVGFISQVERGLTSPSLSSLAAIARALSTPIATFLEQPGSGPDLSRTTERAPYTTGGMTYERLSSNFPGSILRSVIVHEPPGHRAEPIHHEGEELMLVLKGALTVELDGKPVILSQGDSLHFDSRRVHSSWNHTTQTATVLWCGTMDIFGEGKTPGPTHKNKKKQKHNQRREE